MHRLKHGPISKAGREHCLHCMTKPATRKESDQFTKNFNSKGVLCTGRLQYYLITRLDPPVGKVRPLP